MESQNSGIIIAGVTEGKNYPTRKNGKPFLDLTGCKNIIIVDREYFLKNNEEIKVLASH